MSEPIYCEEGVTPPFVRSVYNYDMEKASKRSGIRNDEPSMTQQEFKDDSDINTIVRRFGVTGQLPQGVRAPEYGDFTGISDFRSAVEAVQNAEASFLELPADVRKRFENDPQNLLMFVADERNREEARKLGLLVPEVAPVAPAAPVPEPAKPA